MTQPAQTLSRGKCSRSQTRTSRSEARRPSAQLEPADYLKAERVLQPIHGFRVSRIGSPEVEGRYAVDPEYGGPEYETCAAFGSLCLNDDLTVIAKANELCNKYGLDTIATGVTIALPGITVLRFVGERCVERWSCADMLGVLVQIGAVPTPV